MNKKTLGLSCALLLMSAPAAFANWITGTPVTAAVSGGEAALYIPLTSEQSLSMNLDSATGTADLQFASAKSSIELTDVPVLVEETSVSGTTKKDASVKVTPLINDSNGRRYYIVDTGAPKGSFIISYKGGLYQKAFAPSDELASYDSVRIVPSKKDITVNAKKGDTTAIYLLTLDKDNTFHL